MKNLSQAVDTLSGALAKQPWSATLVPALLGGFIVFVLYASARQDQMAAVSTALLAGGAATAVGAALGFLFGIPRAVQEPAPQGNAVERSRPAYQTNTNLEQISDWLTKIIVGATLIELQGLRVKFKELSKYIATAFGTPPVPPSVVGLALAYFSVTGFLTFYLWTRLFLRAEFERTDREASQSPEFAEGLVQAFLYQPAPRGFESAINSAKVFLQQFGDGNWRVWRYLACAYGQKFGYLKYSKDPSVEELTAARTAALGAIRRVLALNSEEREGLRSLWDPQRATPQENDLTVFYPDTDFAELLVPPAGDTDPAKRDTV